MFKPTNGAYLGYTLPDVLYHAASAYSNPDMFNSREGEGWETLSLMAFKEAVEEMALGLLEKGLVKGDRVALFMESDTHFAIADMACLVAGLIDVPLYLKQSPGNNEYILRHSEARVLVVTTASQIENDLDTLVAIDSLKRIIVAVPEEGKTYPYEHHGLVWDSIQSIRQVGAEQVSEKAGSLKSRVEPTDLATIVYTSGTTGRPKGVMLTHQNMSYNALTGYSELGMTEQSHKEEVAISFLPLTHMFARTIHYSALAYGITTYFSTPLDLGEDMRRVHPTVMAAVPRVIEKVYSKIAAAIEAQTGIKKALASWALHVAKDHDMNAQQSVLASAKLKVADALLLNKWRAALGGRMKYIISGGAALSSDLVNMFAAAGVTILQGYGLTETSPVISFSRPSRNIAGTVGEPLPGVEVKIAKDGEILTRGPHIMKGYFKDPEKTQSVLLEDGWFCTGDIGELTQEGCVRITDRKKDLFKLSTGKYVLPLPLENKLNAHAHIAQSLVIGEGQRYCGCLLFVEPADVENIAQHLGLPAGPAEELVELPQVYAYFESIVAAANEGLDHWTRVKKFCVVPAPMTVENGMLTPTLKVKRKQVRVAYEAEIKHLFDVPEKAVI